MTASPPATCTVALIGNPNTGKSTLFNGLCGVRQRVANYPGVTVEKKTGTATISGRSFLLVDLPGTYSLSPRSPDEMVAIEVLLGLGDDIPRADLVLCIVDAANLERNMFLVSQVIDMERPMVVAVNMMDVAAARSISIDCERLSQRLQVPVIPVQANKGIGLDELRDQLVRSAGTTDVPAPTRCLPDLFQQEVTTIQQAAGRDPLLPSYLVERMLLDGKTTLLTTEFSTGSALAAAVEQARERLTAAEIRLMGLEATSRYAWIAKLLGEIVHRKQVDTTTWNDRLDRVLTHRFWGSLVFLGIMAALFQSIFLIAEPASGLIETAKGWLGEGLEQLVPPGALRSLLVQGVLEGVGGVLVFLPQIFLLFFFIAVLEDCGYMARTAYLMDRLMTRVGLSGKSFIPLLSSFACAIPGIMATRVIESHRDRLVTILVAPLMTCSARLPVYTLLIAAFIPQRRWLGGWIGLQGITMLSMYLLGIVVAITVAYLLKKTILRGEPPPFVLELPSYKFPSVSVVLHRMLDRGWAFVRRAGTLIFAVTVIVWAAAYSPHDEKRLDPQLLARRDAATQRFESLVDSSGDPLTAETLAAARSARARIDHEIEAAHLSNSFLGQAGHCIEPMVRPLGWDWRLGCAAIASFPAREVVIATLGVIFKLGEDQDEQSDSLRNTLQDATWEGTERPVFNIPVALSVMVFFALCAQCASTLAIMKRETNSWRWPIFTFTYMTVLAYLAALATYQVGMLWL